MVVVTMIVTPVSATWVPLPADTFTLGEPNFDSPQWSKHFPTDPIVRVTDICKLDASTLAAIILILASSPIAGW